MPSLACTVRGCGRPLVRVEAALRCPRGHAFDRAREGYWNLLQPQDRRSARPGDDAAAVGARHRWLERGFADGLARALERVGGVDGLRAGASVLDVGCGDGWFVARLAAGRTLDLCGVDLSAAAVRLAARRVPGATWVVANADRGLPLSGGSVEVAFSIFGRRPAAELARALGPGGRLVVAVPGADDLAELRERALGAAAALGDPHSVLEPLRAAGFGLVARETWRERHAHDLAAALDALAMSYRGARRAQERRLRDGWPGGETVEVTLSAELFVLAAPAPGAVAAGADAE